MKQNIMILNAFAATVLLTACNTTTTTTTPNESNETTTTERFTLDSTKGIVTDKETNQIWQNSEIDHGTREEAIAHCQSLNFAGMTGWTLPNSAQSQVFHYGMNAQGDTPVQAFDHCTAEVTSDGYVRTKKGAEKYGGQPGDGINFSGGANIRCVHDGI